MWDLRQLPRLGDSLGSRRCGSRMMGHASDPPQSVRIEVCTRPRYGDERS